MNWLSSILGLKKKSNSEETKVEQYIVSKEPDCPQPFGYKMCWLAIKAEQPEEVIEKLGVKNVCESNWESAFHCISGVERSGQVFVTPCFDGYVLVLNTEDFYEYEGQLNRIAAGFEEVQYFASHRVVDLYAWARYYEGKVNRRYYYCAENEETSWNDGELTEEETKLGLTHLPCGEDEEWEDCTFPEEETVIEIARQWGIDPFLSKYQESKSTGYLCELELV